MPGKLIYYPFAGRADAIRAMLSHAGADYENYEVPMEQSEEAK